MPTNKELIDLYNRYYSSNPKKWVDDRRNEFARKSIEKYLSGQPKTVLDIGCGNGHTLKYLAKHWCDTLFTGIDLSPVAIEIASQDGEGNFEFVCDFVGNASLPKYDCVLCMGVAEHFEDLRAGLEAVRDTVKSGGICFIEIPNCIGYPSSVREEGFRETNFGSRQHEWHLYRPTWDRKIEEAGFKIAQRLEGLNMFTEFCYILEVA